MTDQGVCADFSQKSVIDLGGVGVVTGVTGDLPSKEGGDLLIDVEEGVLPRPDGVIGRSGMGRDGMTEETEEVRLRQKIPHFALGAERRPLLDDVAEFTASEFADLDVDVAPFVTAPVVTPETDFVSLLVGPSPEHIQVLGIRRPVPREVAGLAPQGTVLPELPPLGDADRLRGCRQGVVHLQGRIFPVTPAAEPGDILFPEGSHRVRRPDRRRLEGVAVQAEARGLMGRDPQ